jgi:hypothetical protein
MAPATDWSGWELDKLRSLSFYFERRVTPNGIVHVWISLTLFSLVNCLLKSGSDYLVAMYEAGLDGLKLLSI